MDGAHNDRRRWITKGLFLMGSAGAGKTTVALMLEARGYSTWALAGPIKRMLAELLGREPTKADRALMIDFGQTMRSMFGEGVWCDYAWRNIEDCRRFDETSGLGSFACTIEDGRHLVEYDYFVTQRGFVPVRIVAPDEVRFERLLKRDGVDQRWVDAHERELDNVDIAYTIVNDGTLDELEAKVEAMLAKINGGD
jgi:dephospho-CoA kinase